MVDEYGDLSLDNFCFHTKLSKFLNLNIRDINNNHYNDIGIENNISSNNNDLSVSSIYQNDNFNLHQHLNSIKNQVNLDRNSNHVKRPMNAFMVWSKSERKRMSSANPHLHNADISRNLGYIWRKLSDSERLPYIIESERLRNEHHKKYPDYKYKPKRKATFQRSNNLYNNTHPYIGHMRKNTSCPNIDPNYGFDDSIEDDGFISSIDLLNNKSHLHNSQHSNDGVYSNYHVNSSKDDPMLTFSLNYDLMNSHIDFNYNSTDILHHKEIDQQHAQAMNENTFNELNEILDEISPVSHDIDFYSWNGILDKSLVESSTNNNHFDLVDNGFSNEMLPNFCEKSLKFHSMKRNSTSNQYTSDKPNVPNNRDNISSYNLLNKMFNDNIEFNLLRQANERIFNVNQSSELFDNSPLCNSNNNAPYKSNSIYNSYLNNFKNQMEELITYPFDDIQQTTTKNYSSSNSVCKQTNQFKNTLKEHSVDLAPCDWLTKASAGIQMLD